MNEKVIPIHGGDVGGMASAITALKRELPEIIEHTATIAKIRKASYDAHIAQGFSPEQALELCKTITL